MRKKRARGEGRGRHLGRGEAAAEGAGELGAEVEGQVLALLELSAERGLARLVVDGQDAGDRLADLTTTRPVRNLTDTKSSQKLKGGKV